MLFVFVFKPNFIPKLPGSMTYLSLALGSKKSFSLPAYSKSSSNAIKFCSIKLFPNLNPPPVLTNSLNRYL